MTAVAGREVICAVHVVISVDTHQDEHLSVAIDQQGVRLAQRSAPSNQLRVWAARTVVPKAG